jgi:hypothetical protein
MWKQRYGSMKSHILALHGEVIQMWGGLICYATIKCFYHCSKAGNLKYCSLWRNDTVCRPHSSTQHYRHYRTTLHLTLDTTHCALPNCRSRFTFTTIGPIHISTLISLWKSWVISCFGDCLQIFNKFWHYDTGINCMCHELTSKCYKTISLYSN